MQPTPLSTGLAIGFFLVMAIAFSMTWAFVRLRPSIDRAEEGEPHGDASLMGRDISEATPAELPEAR